MGPLAQDLGLHVDIRYDIDDPAYVRNKVLGFGKNEFGGNVLVCCDRDAVDRCCEGFRRFKSAELAGWEVYYFSINSKTLKYR